MMRFGICTVGVRTDREAGHRCATWHLVRPCWRQGMLRRTLRLWARPGAPDMLRNGWKSSEEAAVVVVCVQSARMQLGRGQRNVAALASQHNVGSPRDVRYFMHMPLVSQRVGCIVHQQPASLLDACRLARRHRTRKYVLFQGNLPEALYHCFRLIFCASTASGYACTFTCKQVFHTASCTGSPWTSCLDSRRQTLWNLRAASGLRRVVRSNC